MSKRIKILVLHNNPFRISSVNEHINCFKKYPNALYYYYSVQRGKMPDYLLKIDFDLIVFHTNFIYLRWGYGPQGFKEKIWPLVEALKTSKAVKIVIPQDEYVHTTNMNDFINEFNVDIVYSVAPESEFPVIYNTVNDKVKIFKVLTGYLAETTLEKIKRLEKTIKQRTLDIGYRAQRLICLGWFGHLKGKIADEFSLHAPKFNLAVDISTRPEDTIYGDAWYEFLLNCKYVIGVEGGSSLLDPDGSIWNYGQIYKRAHPDATLEEFEEACYPGKDGNLKLFALSPRHLECAATKSCQVLVEGDYSGVLKPDIHYIPVKKDFSNIDEVLQKIKEDKLRPAIVERTYNDIVASGKYTYSSFVKYIVSNSLQQKPINNAGFYAFIIFVFNRMVEWYTTKRLLTKDILKGYEILRHIKYYVKVVPYTILIKLGLQSFKEKREAIRY